MEALDLREPAHNHHNVIPANRWGHYIIFIWNLVLNYLRHEGCGSFLDMVNDVRCIVVFHVLCMFVHWPTCAASNAEVVRNSWHCSPGDQVFKDHTCFALFPYELPCGRIFGFLHQQFSMRSSCRLFWLPLTGRVKGALRSGVAKDSIPSRSIEPSSLSVDNTGVVGTILVRCCVTKTDYDWTYCYVVPYQLDEEDSYLFCGQGQRWLPKITLRDNISKLKVRRPKINSLKFFKK
jgi:hypothetical protein